MTEEQRFFQDFFVYQEHQKKGYMEVKIWNLEITKQQNEDVL